jgi:phage baseplate assembly protein W
MATENINSIYYPFAVDPGLGSLMEENDYPKHVEQMIFQVLFTNPGERINLPEFGCGLRQMVFAPNSEVTASLLQTTIFQSLDKWLGTLIDVVSVSATAQDETLTVSIVYLLLATQQRLYLNLQVTL